MFEIIHLHIPKTGGSSLLQVYRQNFGVNSVVSLKRMHLKGKTKEEITLFLNNLQRPEFKILHGHFYWQEVVSFLEKSDKIKLVTFLRHPVDRVISNFFFFKKRIREGKVARGNEHRINESLLEYAALPECKNRMSRFMEGLDFEDFFFVGLMESFNEDVVELFSKLGCYDIVIPRKNINSHFLEERESVTDTEKRIIEKLNHEDMDLYERIRRLKQQKRFRSI